MPSVRPEDPCAPPLQHHRALQNRGRKRILSNRCRTGELHIQLIDAHQSRSSWRHDPSCTAPGERCRSTLPHTMIARPSPARNPYRRNITPHEPRGADRSGPVPISWSPSMAIQPRRTTCCGPLPEHPAFRGLGISRGPRRSALLSADLAYQPSAGRSRQAGGSVSNRAAVEQALGARNRQSPAF